MFPLRHTSEGQGVKIDKIRLKTVGNYKHFTARLSMYYLCRGSERSAFIPAGAQCCCCCCRCRCHCPNSLPFPQHTKVELLVTRRFDFCMLDIFRTPPRMPE